LSRAQVQFGDQAMIVKFLKGIWTHLQITLNDNYTVEGFEKTNKKFEFPPNLAELDPATKRKLTICNLFANQNLSIFEIVHILDSSLHQVVPALIDNGLIKERRRRNRGQHEGRATKRDAAAASLSILPKESMSTDGTAKLAQPTNVATARDSVAVLEEWDA
jgi:hypothetical protein